MQESLTEVLLELENQLLQDEVRQSPGDIDRLLADEFVEFGSSGRIYRIQGCTGGMGRIDAFISDFQAKTLAPGVALATYRLVKHDQAEPAMKHSLRSSIWRLKDGRWQMVFHQGTPSGPTSD